MRLDFTVSNELRFQISHRMLSVAILILIGDIAAISAMPSSHQQSASVADTPTQHRRPSHVNPILPQQPIASDRVVFADRPPQQSPWSIIETGNALRLVSDVTTSAPETVDADDDMSASINVNIKSDGVKGGDSTLGRLVRRIRRSAPANGAHGPETAGLPSPAGEQRHGHGGSSRSHHDNQHQHQQSPLQPVCGSVSEWVRRAEAEDFLGNRVRLVQNIDNGSSRVDQYFYETYCASSSSTSSAVDTGIHQHRRHHDGGSCAGIDSSHYDSVCYETHTLVYGLVANYSLSGEGWTFIKIRSGCNCGLLEKTSGGTLAVAPSNRLRGRRRSS